MRRYSLLAQALELAWVVVISTLIPLGLGLWLDKRYHTAPWLTLVGMVIGVVLSTVSVVRQTSAVFRALDKEHAEQVGRRQAESPNVSPDDQKEDTD
jgi:F0F1-type ATP synthase assembly protein I